MVFWHRTTINIQQPCRLARVFSLTCPLAGEMFFRLLGWPSRMMRQDLGFADGHPDGRVDLHSPSGWQTKSPIIPDGHPDGELDGEPHLAIHGW